MFASKIGEPVVSIDVEIAPNPFEIRYIGEVSEPVPVTCPDDCDHEVPDRVQSWTAGFSLNVSLIAPLIPMLWTFGPPDGPVTICILIRSDGVASQSMAPRSAVKSVI